MPGHVRNVAMDLYRRRLWWRLRRRPRRPAGGEAAMKRTSLKLRQDRELNFERWAFFERAAAP